jgi:penicillin-binding protein 1C
MKKLFKHLSIAFCIAGISAILFYGVVLHIAPFPYERIRTIEYSKCLHDSQGNILRGFTNKSGFWLMPVELDEINPQLINATLSIEDNRFRKHFGVDPFAVMRALGLNLKNGRIISGASTISMQVMRLIEGRQRSFPNKIIEAVHAIHLERLYSKDEILRLYLELAPYGGNIHGVKAASFRYFNKHLAGLTLSECALLAGIPQSPTRLRPNRYPDKAAARRDRVLLSMLKNNYITKAQYDTALKEPVSAGNNILPFKTPHFAEFVHRRYSKTKNVHTTLDPAIQHFAENALSETVNSLKPYGVTNGAIVVIENATGSIRAMVGSADFFSRENSGQINGALSRRCPGSTLKPFTYALGFEQGLFTPSMILSDKPVQYNGYSPTNYDNKFRGDVSVREALVDSLNVPAVEVLNRVGYRNLYRFLRSVGITTLNQLPEHYGLALTLGAGEVNLLELTNAYAALARLGEYKPYTFIEGKENQSRRILSEAAAYLVADITSDTKRLNDIGIHRDNNIHPKIAWKTGTSYGNKDAWTICYNPEYTIGVWLGNFSARTAKALVGVDAAAPIGVKIFDWLYLRKPAPWYNISASIGERRVCSASGQPIGDNCKNSVSDLYIKNRTINRPCPVHEKGVSSNVLIDFDRARPNIISPSHRCEYFISNTSGNTKLNLQATSAPDSEKLYWFVNGKFYTSSDIGDKILWDMELGQHKITCSDSFGRSSSVIVTIR